MTLSIVGRRGQVTIPKEIRSRIPLQEGDRIAFTLSNNKVIIEPVKTTLLDLRGTIEVSDPQDFDAIRKQVLTFRGMRGKTDER